MEVIVEVLGTTNNVLARERFAQERVRLGRGFGNDLIIDDVHVDLEHAEIGSDENGQLYICDLGSVNGIKRRGKRLKGDRNALRSGDILSVGRSRIRVYEQCHTLPEALPIRGLESTLLMLGRPQMLLLLLGLLLLLSYLAVRQSSVEEFAWAAFLGGNLAEVLAFSGLVAGVYLLSVLFRRSGNFPAHLSVLLLIAVLSYLLDFALFFSRFNSGDGFYPGIDWVDSVTDYLLVFAYLWAVLYLAFSFSVRVRSAIAAGVVGVLLFFSWVSDDVLEELRFFPGAPLRSEFMPSAFRIAPVQSPQAFSEAADELFDRADKRRAERLAERPESTAKSG